MSLQSLYARYASTLPPGKLEWIGLRPARREPMQSCNAVQALAGLGLAGDHRCQKTPGSARQVTLISREFIQQIAQHCGYEQIDPARLRRNLVISGINLNALRYQRFQLGGAIFEATALCHPCSRMEQALGPGGVAAMLGYGGLCCKVLQTGQIQLGDELRVLTEDSSQMSLFSPHPDAPNLRNR
ncbi:MOSC domain-containing protein [Pontibacter sp. JAM-7]|uniref:MOSC domain-containing protein n=1 Tax=Pontibacter sp. JAM-7 TaxID=3366581 RepID=UPI003AF4E4D5